MRAMLAAIALLVAGCPGGNGKAEPPKPPPDAAAAPAPDAGTAPAAQLTPEQEAMADRAIAMTQDMATKLQAAAGDCAKMAAAVNTWVDTNGAEHDRLFQEMMALPEETQKVLAARMEEKTRANAESFRGLAKAVKACEADPEFAKAWERFES